jgi:hypothetical protein
MATNIARWPALTAMLCGAGTCAAIAFAVGSAPPGGLKHLYQPFKHVLSHISSKLGVIACYVDHVSSNTKHMPVDRLQLASVLPQSCRLRPAIHTTWHMGLLRTCSGCPPCTWCHTVTHLNLGVQTLTWPLLHQAQQSAQSWQLSESATNVASDRMTSSKRHHSASNRWAAVGTARAASRHLLRRRPLAC